ncbi:MAG: methylenetetrahydrofolate--tRNA-(uracil(54)-C(5))-methyltransferase (FADH(2)-oxidizing) TrmFO [Anaerolineaceae bacterium]
MDINRIDELSVIGGGLAGCEVAWQAATRGLKVNLYEMRPVVMTPAHTGGDLAELVCSNSLGSALSDRPSGLLMEEMRLLGSLILDCADKAALPAGGALAVDRARFSEAVTARINQHPNITLHRQEVKVIPSGLTVIASGPLTSPHLSQVLRKLTGEDSLYFYDAIAPVVSAESIDMGIAFRASRYDRGVTQEGDYINCPFTVDEYETFVAGLLTAERIELKPFEDQIDGGIIAGSEKFFEGCLPVEVLAGRGLNSLAFGPMRPIGLRDPRTGHRPHAVIQLRQDNLSGSLYNMVGFQTNLTYPEQKRVFRTVPGLAKAEFVRFGQMHRNTFIASPRLLDETLCFRSRPELLFAGQITGVEGYLGNAATGVLAGINATRLAGGLTTVSLPLSTMLGVLCHYITHADPESFQPMKANFGLLPDLEPGEKRVGKREKHALMAERSLTDLKQWIQQYQVTG